ncbi:peptidoglycan-binding domain-containing protein [Dyella caseinilytica]|uniref:Peptidoglycan-binding protein n=1 Tax=Dyella caseinilytica TaxID=1849581 RepID=A0ABX7GWT3_9GAMM|nr:peptidoglycan-binding domain-containing protein [Dyella caseinilytica]QRN54177.1 peptidoglycan-binding protein [Dyella caseinilytica]GFZ92128.1 hypothetical protein GCM10011408_09510 [Dyella caseinilytica]
MQGRHGSGLDLPSGDDTHSPAMLKFGEQGEAVRELQRQLSKIGYHDIDGAPRADGAFGHRTRYAVEAFQYDYGLIVDGVVGPKTSAALKHAQHAHRVFRSSTDDSEQAMGG